MAGALLLALDILGCVAAQSSSATLLLEIRVFLAAEEVTGDTRVTLHRAGDRSSAVAPATGQPGRHVFSVPAGIYDAQVVRERDGKVLNIKWAERLVVMPYPDEGGRHLEAVNFTTGHGALQIKATPPAELPDLAIFSAGARTRPAAVPAPRRHDDDYVLYVLPAARYDVQIKSGPRPAWHTDLDIPLDRTRLWLIP
jgi:hypothetical protein